MDLAVNLFGESEPYGPKPKNTDPFSKKDENGRPVYQRFKPGARIPGTGTDALGGPSMQANNPLGAPPLDWWVIDG